MEKSAETVSQRKFTAMSTRRRHQLLIQLAQTALERDDHSRLWDRYHQMTAWSEMDRFRPPPQLTAREAVQQLIRFHQVLAGPEKPDSAHDARVWQPKHNVSILLDGVRTPYNIGSTLRLIDNFGFADLHHGSQGLNLEHAQLGRAARGTQHWIPCHYHADPAHWLSQETRPIIGLETGPSAVSIYHWQPPAACVLVFGNEEHGISGAVRDRLQQQLMIPMWGFKNSMNLTHALAVAGSHFLEKICKKQP